MKIIYTFLVFLGLTLPVLSQNNPLWLRYPAISPDGNEIVFGYKGDLFKVSTDGGTALPLTLHEAHDQMPVWSPDGKQIAFASDRYGNFDVYVIPSYGGEARRLTFHSGNDIPWDFSPDGKHIIFSSPRNDLQSSVRFPNKGLFGKLYQVPVAGGRSTLLSTAGFQSANYDLDGSKIIFQDRKGYEDEWRKRHTSSVTRDIWIYDLNTKKFTQISDFEGEDREPIFSSDGKSAFYLSEKNGAQNIFKREIASGQEEQLTNFKDHPVRHLSRSDKDLLSFSWNGEIYTLKEGGEPQKVNISIFADFRGNEEKIVSVNGGATEMALSPNGKEIAFVFRGEIFVTSADNNLTKRITNTAAQERMLSWSEDGRTLFYSTERGDSWDIYKASIVRSEEPYFYTATLIKEEPVIASDKDEFQPLVSPDGKEIAYLEERNTLKIFNLGTKTSRTIIPEGQNFSYSDGDQDFTWSPDSKWIIAKNALGYFGGSHMVLYDALGTQEGVNLTNSGFSDGGGKFAMKGKAFIWANDKDGKKPLAFQGSRELDIYAMFFDKEAYDRFRLSKDEYELTKEIEDKEKGKNKEKDKSQENDKDKVMEPLVLDVENIEDRKLRLTTGSVNLSSFELSPDGDKLFFMASFEDKYDVWSLDTRTKELKSLAKTNSGPGTIKLDKEGKNLFVLANGKISKVETATGKISNVGINAEMVLNSSGEREYIFHHAWRQVKKKFYDPKLHGIDWDMYRANYARFLPHINNNYDFQELLSEILGELNGSHTGGRYSHRPENGDATASLGLFYDETALGAGLKIEEVIPGGPMDKAQSKVKAGHVLEKIDGIEINDAMDWNLLLNRKADKNVLLSLYDPGTKSRYDETVKPIAIGAENALVYKRWVKSMREMVDELSDGKIGYVHVQGMNDGSYRVVFDEVLGRNADKEALIVDTRFNGGGWLHEDLSTFLDGKPYATFRPYGLVSKGGEPRDKWSKPSVVLMSESNYSDAHAFPYAYRAKGIGKLIGMPVPGTSTAVWWEAQIDPTIVFGIPMIAFYGVEEDRPLENLQLEPDIKVATPFEEILYGKDAQIEAAVKALLKEIK
ncbi:S41 family peptidase [Aquiflexum lacus]|uniref:S41 family peptidase n=1 Tax=Aquiflexum lacus TaxID=2483805 RepID=UPI0018939F08|nr:S41 family peptidase [Aquiflexum lacus]